MSPSLKRRVLLSSLSHSVTNAANAPMSGMNPSNNSATPMTSGLHPSPSPSTDEPSLERIVGAICIGLSVTRALGRLHKLGLIHRAIVPESILLPSTAICTPSNSPHLSQFNSPSSLSRSLVHPFPPSPDLITAALFLDLSHAAPERISEPATSLHASSTRILTYGPPELSGKAHRSVDGRSDLYALASVLYEYVTGRPPFVASDAAELIHMHLARSAPLLAPFTSTSTNAGSNTERKAPPHQPTGASLMLGANLINSHHITHPNPSTSSTSSSTSSSSSSSSSSTTLSLVDELTQLSTRALSNVLSKLLSKPAEERYQSAVGLEYDLKWLLITIRDVQRSMSTPVPTTIPHHSASATNTPTSTLSSLQSPRPPALDALAKFRVGQFDRRSTFALSPILYGRENILTTLLKALSRVTPSNGTSQSDLTPNPFARAGASSLNASNSSVASKNSAVAATAAVVAVKDVLTPASSASLQSPKSYALNDPSLTLGSSPRRSRGPTLGLLIGDSGVGKSSIADELHRHTLRQRNLFARAKFEQPRIVTGESADAAPFSFANLPLAKRSFNCLVGAIRLILVQLLSSDATFWRQRFAPLGLGPLTVEMTELTRFGVESDEGSLVEMNTTESINKFVQCFCTLVDAIASIQTLIIFLDDMMFVHTDKRIRSARGEVERTS